jgi:ABC-2 type transport system ATP-binding protein
VTTIQVSASRPLQGLREPSVSIPAEDVVVGVRGITKSYPLQRSMIEIARHPLARPRVAVLRGISFDVRRGELFGLLGLNGAGKTTLLKILATLGLPDAGAATIEGHDIVSDAGVVRDQLAIVTADERSLHWRLSALENLRLFAGLHRLNAHEARTRIAEALAAVGLADTGDKMVGAFSSGMRQRLLVARALLPRPRVFLLDEPTRSLDPLSAHDFRRLIRDLLIGERGATVLLATHNAEEAFTYCDRVAVLHRGSIAAMGSASSLASSFAREQYRVWTTTPDHWVFAALALEGLVRRIGVADAEPDAITFEIVGGDGAAARVLRRLVESGASISRFERVPLALSALIAHIAAAHEAAVAQEPRDA